MSMNRIIAVIIGLILLVFVVDWVWFAHRSRKGNAGGALGSVTYYYASGLKDGKAEVYFDQPQAEVCAHSLFPHSGYSPCWYSSRKSNVRMIN